jgi:dodecin
MNGHVYGLSEIVGSSTQGVDDAIRVAVQRAARTLRGLDWFEVTNIRGHLADGEIEHFQVTLKIGSGWRIRSRPGPRKAERLRACARKRPRFLQLSRSFRHSCAKTIRTDYPPASSTSTGITSVGAGIVAISSRSRMAA